MDNSFFAYLQQLELMAFFSGYPLIYAIAQVFSGSFQSKNRFTRQFVPALPSAYALVGTLFLGFQSKKLYPDYSIEHINNAIHHPFLVVWGLMSVLFWIPALRKKGILALIHSLVFFFFLLKDLVAQLSVDNDIIRNDMKVYTASLLLNLGALVICSAISLLLPFLKTFWRSDR